MSVCVLHVQQPQQEAAFAAILAQGSRWSLVQQMADFRPPAGPFVAQLLRLHQGVHARLTCSVLQPNNVRMTFELPLSHSAVLRLHVLLLDADVLPPVQAVARGPPPAPPGPPPAQQL